MPWDLFNGTLSSLNWNVGGFGKGLLQYLNHRSTLGVIYMVCGWNDLGMSHDCTTTLLLFFQETTEPMQTHFLLADNVYCKASVPPTDKVCLWLGVSIHPPVLKNKCLSKWTQSWNANNYGCLVLVGKCIKKLVWTFIFLTTEPRKVKKTKVLSDLVNKLPKRIPTFPRWAVQSPGTRHKPAD